MVSEEEFTASSCLHSGENKKQNIDIIFGLKDFFSSSSKFFCLFLSYVGDLSNEEPDTRMRRFSFGEIMAVGGIIAGSVTLGQVIGIARSSVKMLATSGTGLSFNYST